MKKEIKQTVQPQLRKKNGVWVKVLVPALCIVAGAGAMAGLVYGVPAVNNAFITNKDGTTTKPSGEVLDLKNQISELTTKLQNATTLADERGNKIAELNSQIEQIKADSALSEEQKQEQIDLLTAQLNQAIVDKEQAEGLVAGLQAQIEALQAKIDQMEGNAVVDTLQLENFVGTWYKNGTFEDYFTIEGTTITRGANEDKGVIYKLYNQVYLGLNSMDNTACTLSENGTKITLADGTEYTKSFINTLENTSINMGIIAGEYSYGAEKIVLNSDNTSSYFDGTNTYYGAFTATATEKNVGGNITITHYITLTLNKDSGQEIMEFSFVNDNGHFKVYEKDFYKIMSNNILKNDYVQSKRAYVDVLVKLKEPIKLTSTTQTIDVYYEYVSQTSGYYLGVVDFNADRVKDGITSGEFRYSTLTIPEINENLPEKVEYINFRFSTTAFNARVNLNNIFKIQVNKEIVYFDIVKIDDSNNECVDDLGTNNKVTVSGNLEKYLTRTYYKNCSTISDYLTGPWSNETVSVNLTTEQATVTPSGVEEPITATEYTVTAKTDGTNIIHTVTVKYTDTSEVEHTLTFDITNNAITTTTAYLDEEEIVLNKG